VYYSKSGNTRRVALQIREKTGADCYEVKPSENYHRQWMPYWNAIKHFITRKRTEILKNPPNFDAYEIIFVGCPIWAGTSFHTMTIPPPMCSFLEQNRFQNKVVVPFATCESHFGRFFEIFEQKAKDARVVNGLVFKKVQKMSEEMLNEQITALLKKVAELNV
jgi:flavodoxin